MAYWPVLWPLCCCLIATFVGPPSAGAVDSALTAFTDSGLDELLMSYTKAHAQASQEPISSDRQYLVWFATIHGFGNRVRALLSSLWASIVMQKVFYVVWNSPVHYKQLLTTAVDFDAKPHLERLHAHFGQPDTSMCIPCSGTGEECVRTL